ncbi:MAG: hypothetical protein WCJ93_07095 [Methanomicrobiales archaeon]
MESLPPHPLRHGHAKPCSLPRLTGLCDRGAGEIAFVELEALSLARNGIPFRNSYCWICRFDQGTIVEVRAYLDSALVQKLLDENEPGPL